MADLLLGPIVGGLTATSVNLWGKATGLGSLYAWLGRQPDLTDAKQAGVSLPLTEETGFAGVVRVQKLSTATPYHYTLTLTDHPPDPAQGPYPGFTTFPQKGSKSPFSFAFGSCFRPEDAQSGRVFEAIEERRQADDLQFILLLGDQIYADDFNHNHIGKVATTLEDYRDIYRYVWSNPSLRRLLMTLPAFMMMDDHEVDDDWSWADLAMTRAQIPIWDWVWRWLKGRPPQERRLPRDRVLNGLQVFWEHQGMHAPQFNLIAHGQQGEQSPPGMNAFGPYAYAFTYGCTAFFVLDTRSQRVKSRRGDRLLGRQQWVALESWLMQVNKIYPVKFLVTSSSLLFDMWMDPSRDRWNGFPDERDRLLDFLVQNGINGVYFITGDLHSAHATRVDLRASGGRTLSVMEFCSSPFEQVPNRLAKYTFRPLRGDPVAGQQLYFVRNQPNFGVVQVEFPEHDRPRVVFRLYGERGQLLESAGSGR